LSTLVIKPTLNAEIFDILPVQPASCTFSLGGALNVFHPIYIKYAAPKYLITENRTIDFDIMIARPAME